MSQIIKPHGDFTAGTVAESAKVNDQFNTVYADYNGNIADENIKAGANIQQSKILNLATDLNSVKNRLGYELINLVSAVNVAFVDFFPISSTLHDQYLLTLNNVKLSAENSGIALRMWISGGFLAGASDYSYVSLVHSSASATPTGQANTTTGIVLTDNSSIVSTLGGRTINGEIRIFSLSAVVQKVVTYDITHFDASGNIYNVRGSGAVVSSNQASTGIRVVPFSGHLVSSGLFALYGLRARLGFGPAT